MEKFDINLYYKIFKNYNFYDEQFYDFSIKEYEAKTLVHVLKSKKPEKILIIGAFKGFSTLIILKENPNQNARIWCIDPFFNNYYAGNEYKQIYNKIIGEFDSLKSTTTLQGYATLAGEEVFNLTSDSSNYYNPDFWFKINEINETFDMIFIDGDHKFETALIDFIESWKKLNNGGIILIHDTEDKLWKKELSNLINYIKKIPSANITTFDKGINGLVVVQKEL